MKMAVAPSARWADQALLEGQPRGGTLERIVIAIAKINDRYFGSGSLVVPSQIPPNPPLSKGGLGGFQGTRASRAIRTEFLADCIRF
jgi:hypothetical protein